MIKVDLTRKENADYQQLLTRYNVKGVPTVVFLNRNGVEKYNLRLVDFLPPVQFLSRMTAVRKINK